MSTLSLRLPDSIHRELKELAKEDGISINQFISLAVAEKVSCLKTVDYLKRRASKATPSDLLSILDLAPDIEPEEKDKIQG